MNSADKMTNIIFVYSIRGSPFVSLATHTNPQKCVVRQSEATDTLLAIRGSS